MERFIIVVVRGLGVPVLYSNIYLILIELFWIDCAVDTLSFCYLKIAFMV